MKRIATLSLIALGTVAMAGTTHCQHVNATDCVTVENASTNMPEIERRGADR